MCMDFETIYLTIKLFFPINARSEARLMQNSAHGIGIKCTNHVRKKILGRRSSLMANLIQEDDGHLIMSALLR